MQYPVVNTKGEPAGKIDLPGEIFAKKGSLRLLAQAVRVYLSNKRHAAARVKTRGEVSGSGRKIWRQKGTGKARHGDAYAPIFVGGGVAHGPTGEQNYKMKLSKILRRKTLLLALTKKLESNELVIVEGLEDVKPKTKQVNQVIKKLAGEAKRVTLVVPENSHSLIRGARNIKGVKLLSVETLNAYDILNGGKILLLKNSLFHLKDSFFKKEKLEKREGAPEVKVKPLPKKVVRKETQRQEKTRSHQEKRNQGKKTK